MQLGQLPFTVGNKTRYRIDYDFWLEEDESLTTTAVTVDVADVTISGVLVNPDKTVTFFAEGATVSDLFTVSIQTFNSRTEEKNDTILFNVVDP